MLGTNIAPLETNAKAWTPVTQGKAEAKAYWELKASYEQPGQRTGSTRRYCKRHSELKEILYLRSVTTSIR